MEMRAEGENLNCKSSEIEEEEKESQIYGQ
jgi:hypothetical protein